MTATGQDIKIISGEYKRIDASPLTDEDGNPVNLQGSEIKWVIADEGEILVEKTTAGGGINITSESDGEWEIVLEPSDTEEYSGKIARHEGRVTDANGRESVVTKGKFTIEESDT